MAEPNLKTPSYVAMATLPVGVVLFIGAIVAILAKVAVLGGVLMALSIVILAVGVGLLLLVRKRTGVVVADLRAKREADTAKLLREHPELRDQPEFRNFLSGEQQP
jgi:hypothetical protein